jgi:hypothetical protein
MIAEQIFFFMFRFSNNFRSFYLRLYRYPKNFSFFLFFFFLVKFSNLLILDAKDKICGRLMFFFLLEFKKKKKFFFLISFQRKNSKKIWPHAFCIYIFLFKVTNFFFLFLIFSKRKKKGKIFSLFDFSCCDLKSGRNTRRT